MSDHFPSQHRSEPPQSLPARRWLAAVDWLGAQKPIEIILGMIAIIGAIAWIAQLAR